MIAKSKELRKWYRKPFLSKPPSGRALRAAEAKPCSHCGSVVVIGGDTLVQSRQYDRVFCDIECAGQYKRWHNRTHEYREKSGLIANEQLRNEALVEDQKRRVICCSACGCAFRRTTKRSKFCSGCIKDMENARFLVERRKRILVKTAIVRCKCEVCGVCFERRREPSSKLAFKVVRFCSNRCCKKHHRRLRNHRERTTVSDPKITLAWAVKRFRNKCCYCGVVCCDPTGRNLDNEQTLEHVLPLSKGGLHIASNVKLACRSCNSKKTDSVIGDTQYMLLLT